MTVLIGVLGPAGSGKSMVANYLVERYGARRFSLAGPLKEIAIRAFDFTDEQVYGTQAQKEAVDPRYGQSPRWFLQRLGTEGIRSVFGEDVWVNLLMRSVAEARVPLAVCDDVRFVNEAKIIKGWYPSKCAGDVTIAGQVWRLESPWRETTADASHASEAEWMKCEYDYIIAPTKYGVENLYKLIDDRCQKIGLRKT